MRILLLQSIPHSSEALHPRNAFKGSYDMARLVSVCPALAPHIIPASASKGGKDTINFSDSSAVKNLNRAILAADYGIAEWDIPEGKLCPPIPGRADYIHHMGDVLAYSAGSGTVPRGSRVKGMVSDKIFLVHARAAPINALGWWDGCMHSILALDGGEGNPRSESADCATRSCTLHPRRCLFCPGD